MANAQGLLVESIKDTIAPGLSVYDTDHTKVGTVWQVNRLHGYFMARSNRLPVKHLYIPFRLITNIDPRELFVSATRKELYGDYAQPPPRSTRIEQEFGLEFAVTTEPSGYDGTPIVVRRAEIDALKRAIAVGGHVYSSDPADLGTITQYDSQTGWITIARDMGAQEPTLRVPISIVDVVNADTHDVYLVWSEADLARARHLEPA